MTLCKNCFRKQFWTSKSAQTRKPALSLSCVHTSSIVCKYFLTITCRRSSNQGALSVFRTEILCPNESCLYNCTIACTIVQLCFESCYFWHPVYFKKTSAAPFGNRSRQLRGAWVCTFLQNLQGGAALHHQTETRWTEKEKFLWLSTPLVKPPPPAEWVWPDTLATIQGVGFCFSLGNSVQSWVLLDI